MKTAFGKFATVSLIFALAFAAVFSAAMPAKANSAQTRWEGTTSTGITISGNGDSPIVVDSELLTFDITNEVGPYSSEDRPLNTVTARYTFRNPTDSEITVFAVFPFMDGRNGYDYGSDHRGKRAKHENVRDEITYDECCASSDEPASDHTQHASDAEHRALAAPSPVGERAAHGYHKGDVCRREGQLHARTDGNEQTCQHEVDRGAYLVEGCTLRQYSGILVEARADPAAQWSWYDGSDSPCSLLSVAHDDSRYCA